jgi:hypothetical protein
VKADNVPERRQNHDTKHRTNSSELSQFEDLGTRMANQNSNGQTAKENLAYKIPVRTSQENYYVSTTDPSWLMLRRI